MIVLARRTPASPAFCVLFFAIIIMTISNIL